MTSFAASLSPSAFGAALDSAFQLSTTLTYSTNFQGQGINGVTTPGPFGFSNTAYVHDVVGAFQFYGNISYTGGAAGFVQNTLQIQTVAGPGVTNYVWGFMSVLKNSATGGQNTGGYFQAHRVTAATGPTWAGTIEVIEDVAINNPTSGTIGLEVDNRSSGTDTSAQRIIVDAVATRTAPGTGVATVCSYGYRLQAGSEGANAAVTYGFSCYAGLNVNIAFDAAQATIGQAAFRCAQNQLVAFDAAMANGLLYNGSGISYSVSGTSKVLLGNTGFIAINSTQVLGSQITGYGTPTGGSHQASFNAAGITLANLAACVAQLIVDLKTHGMIGA